MKPIVALLCILCMIKTLPAQNDYNKVWQVINNNDRSTAKKLLQQIKVTDPNYASAYVTNLYLAQYEGKDRSVTNFATAFYDQVKNPYPYLYALWFDNAVLGSYGKKSAPHQIQIMDKLINDSKVPGTLLAAARYQKGMHLLFSSDFSKAQNYYNEIGNIKNWQYAGPFENLSETGFYKSHGPLEHAEPTALFTSLNNAPITWFTPAKEITDGWNPVIYQFNKRTAIVYAQNFLVSDKAQTGLLNVGVSGSVKVWVNDELLIAEPRERITELDTYTIPCTLNKGTNRVLVQLGYTDMGYPNFTVRFTDEAFKTLPGIMGNAAYSFYNKALPQPHKMLQPFAEAFFTKAIANDPSDFVNYLLLCDVYLRNNKIVEARNTIGLAIKQAPSSSLLRLKLVEILIKDNNKVLMQEELETIKRTDAESLVVLDLEIKDLFKSEKFEDGELVLLRRIALFGEDETTDAYKVTLLVHDEKYDELVKVGEKLYEKNPDNAKVLDMMYTIKKEVYKDNKGALDVYRKFLENNYNYDVYNSYAEKLEAAGNNAQALELKQKLVELFPYSPEGFKELAKYFSTTKNYSKATTNMQQAIALSPYNESYWEAYGDVLNLQNKPQEALAAYNKSLLYDPQQYELINKIRKLAGKKEFYKLFDETDIDKAIAADKPDEAKNTEKGYYYILDEKNVMLHAGGAVEEYYTLIVKIISDNGVEEFKESSIGYDNNQNLLIEKSEIRKKNKAKIEGERNGNQVVFANLEPGDILVFKYRLQRYTYGRFAKDFWDRFSLGSQAYTSVSRYNLIVPDTLKINYKMSNASIEPAISKLENFIKYKWENINATPLATEVFMPSMADVAPTLHVSTLNDWKAISNWYSDVVNNKADEDVEMIDLNNSLFTEKEKGLSQYQKAKRIYNYIQANIRYSSVSFRQSAYVPQRPASTLTTRLGDCKDLSSLFVTLAHMQGINAQVVLVNTRDNGRSETVLPGIVFNHCIVRATLDKQPFYLELTDNNLPFASLPNNLNGAAALDIPSKSANEAAVIQFLNTPNRTKEIVRRTIDVMPGDNDIDMKVRVVKYGHLSSNIRYNYLDLDNKKRLEELEKSVAGSYKNNVKLSQVSFGDLEELNDSIYYQYSCKVKNEVAEIGSLKTFKIVYPDIVASLDNFSSDTRNFPIEYWRYEDTDAYETEVNITAPVGKKFVELPVSETFGFADMKFSIVYKLVSPGKLKILRKFYNSRQQQIAAKDYEGFKSFFEKIVKAEQKFIAFK